jgi:peptidoglycan/LPS O-acetylase OafA/YrhL
MPKRLGYVPALDGLRGVAIALVVSAHYVGVPYGGQDGVDLFFVLSGFLITTLLLEERTETGRISLRGFYIRRIRRLLPALVVMLATYSLISILEGHDPSRDLELLGFYSANVTEAFVGWFPSGLDHLWSLAEEEQFYLVWPLLLLVFVRTRRLLTFTVALAAVLVLYRAGLTINGTSMTRLYNGPDTHSDGLVIGAILAIVGQRRSLAVPEGLPPWIVGAFVLAVLITPINTGWQIAGLPLFELVCAGLIAAAVTGSSLVPVLSWRPLVFLGKISYSLYLWHYMLFWAFGFAHALVALPISVACALLSYRFVEQPFRLHRGDEATAVPRTTISAPAAESL